MKKPISVLRKVAAFFAVLLILRSCYAVYHYRQFVNASEGITYYNEGRYKEAAPRLQNLRELEPTNVRINAYVGYSFFKINDYPAAIAAYRALTKTNAIYYDDFYYFGLCLAAVGCRNEAVANWQEGLKRAKQAYKIETGQDMPGSSTRLVYIKSVEHSLSANIAANKGRQ